MNASVSDDKLKSLSQSFFINKSTVIWGCLVPLLITAPMWSFVKLPGKFFFLFLFTFPAALHFSEKYLFIADVYYVVRDRLHVCNNKAVRVLWWPEAPQSLSGQDPAPSSRSIRGYWSSPRCNPSHCAPSWGQEWAETQARTWTCNCGSGSRLVRWTKIPSPRMARQSHGDGDKDRPRTGWDASPWVTFCVQISRTTDKQRQGESPDWDEGPK